MKHFLAVSDLSSGEVQDLRDLAIKLKEEISRKATHYYSAARFPVSTELISFIAVPDSHLLYDQFQLIVKS